MKKWLHRNLMTVTLVVLLIAGAGRYQSAFMLIGSDKTPVRVESNGGLAVNVQDQTSPAVDLFFTQAIGVPTELTNAVAIGDKEFVADSVADISIGNYIGVFSGTSEEGRFYFAEVTNVVSTTVTVDTPFDFAYDAGDPVISSTRDMNVDGSSTPQTFSVTNRSTTDITVDITRIMFSMTLSTAGDDAKFGNITKLANGLVFRRTDGDTRNIFNVKDNGELRALCFDLTYPVRSGGGSDFGLGARYTFAGQDKHGVALRLMPGDSLDVIIQDNLVPAGGTTGILRFRMVAPGHITFD